MKISAKGRYAVCAMIKLAAEYGSGETLSTQKIAERLGISKIYLEQVFSQLRHAGLIGAEKGTGGGYKLKKGAEQISVYDILSVTESGLFEPVEPILTDKAPAIENAFIEEVINPLDKLIVEFFSRKTLKELYDEALKRSEPDSYMFYI
ncbi:MAG: Rrf2 family transcriptional regulator [Ruminococcus sp.]|jgi:Rrf2 family protein|nr:Rrf2 family transcriptional regulator [Ruminococcus sp.]